MTCAALAVVVGLVWPFFDARQAVGQAGAARLEACRAAVAADPDGWNNAHCWYTLGRDPSPFVRAAARRALSRLVAGTGGGPAPYFALARLEQEAGDLEAARGLYRSAAERYALRGQGEGELWCRLNLSDIDRALGDLTGAGAEAAAAAVLAASLGRPALAAGAKVQSLDVQVRAGRRLDQVAHEASTLYRDLPAGVERSTRYRLLRLLGEVHLLRMDHVLALERFEQLRQLADRARDDHAAAAALHSLASVHLSRPPSAGIRETVRKLLTEGLRLAERSHHTEVAIRCQVALARLDPVRLGVERLRDAVARAEASGRPDLQVLAQGALAAKLVPHRPVEARGLWDGIHALESASDEPWLGAYSWLDRMTLAWATLPRAEAIQASLAVLDGFEALRTDQHSGAGRAAFFAPWTEAYTWLASRLLTGEAGRRTRLADHELAFNVVERMRARVLAERLMRGAEGPVGAGTEGASPSEVTLAEVQAALAPEEALLGFHIGLDHNVFGEDEGGGWLLVTTRETVAAHRVGGRAWLETAVPVFTDRSRAGRVGDADGLGTVLYDALLDDALAGLPATVERLIVIPDGVLHRLPFGALPAGAGEATLVERFVLAYAPSAALWSRWRASVPETRRAALVLADPRPPEGVVGGVGGALVRAGPGPERWQEDATAWPRLPFARREGRRVARLLGGRVTLRIGTDAREEEVRRRAPSLAVLHVAAHAVADAREPERSMVVLAPDPEGRGEDGSLEAAEIEALDLQGALVVLSACDGAGGGYLLGEGPMSLARSFFAAGAHAVVASLWPLRDDQAAVSMERLYRELRRGTSVAEALARVQRRSIGEGASVRAWGGLVVLGDGGHVPFPGGRGRSATSVLWLAMLGLLVLGWAWRGRRARGAASHDPIGR